MKEKPVHLVVLDGYTANPGDLDWSPLAALGNLTVFDRTPSELLLERAAPADILLLNKTPIGEKDMAQLPRLRCICVLATGYNIVDVAAAKRRDIVVCNVRGYAANSVAQHVFALLLELTNRVGAHNASVRAGGWAASPDWSYTLSPIMELAGKTFGIYGFGQIGQRVAEIALTFGMKVIACHKHPERDARPNITFVSFETLMAQSDVVSLHAPLTHDNALIINEKSLALMKPSALLINTGRGGLVNEADLKVALEMGVIAGAALDVLSTEPPLPDHLLIGVKNCIVTPHNAWAAKEARQRLIAEAGENVRAFLEGRERNRVI